MWFCFSSIHDIALRYCSSFLEYWPCWGCETSWKKWRKVLGQRKHQSQDLRRRQKQNLLKARRKTWPIVTSDPSNKLNYPLVLHFLFSTPYIFLFFQISRTLKFNKENVRDSGHTITAFEFPRTSFRSLWMVGVPSFHWPAAYILLTEDRNVFTNLQMAKTRNRFSRE